MTGQTRMGSFIEAWVNTAVGWTVNFSANMVVLPWFGFNVTVADAFGIGVVFTVISVARSYFIRRYFNARIAAFAQRLGDKLDA